MIKRTLKKLSYIFLSINLFIGCSNKHSTLYDAKVKKLLDKQNLSYQIDQDGDFKVNSPSTELEGNLLGSEEVWIISHLKNYEDLPIREIFSLVLALPNNISASLLESLLQDSYNNRFLGSWVIIRKEPNLNYLAYLVKIIGDINQYNLLPILKEVTKASLAMREVLLASVNLEESTKNNGSQENLSKKSLEEDGN